MCASAYECMRACLRLYTHVYTYIFEESAREWLKFYEATVPVPVPYTILELGLYIAKADIAIIHTRIMRKVLVFAHSIPFLYIHMYSVRIFAKKNRKERTRARTHTRDATHTVCMHTHMCVRRAYSREKWIRQTSFIADGVLYINAYIVYLYLCARKREEDMVANRPTNSHASIQYFWRRYMSCMT